jgi:hypothetical protein
MKTAVEWLQEQYNYCPKYEEQIHDEDWEKALEMEKEYIKKGWLQDRDITFGDWQQEFEQWYNETFKQQEQ